MKRKLLFLFALLVSTTMARAADVVYSTCIFGPDYNSEGVAGYASAFTTTNGGFTWNVVNANNNSNTWAFIKFGSKSFASTGYVSTAAAYSAAITQVTVTIDAINTSYVNSITLYTSSDGSAWSSAGTFTKALGAQSVTLASPTANLYYKVELNCAVGSGNGFVQVSQIQFYRAPDENVPSHTATFYRNGRTFHTTSLKEGQPIDFPVNTPEDVAGRRFMGWATAEIVGTQAQKPAVVASATMSTSDVNFYAVFATISVGQYEDVLSNSVIGLADNTSYGDWSGKTMSSSAVYAGNSSGNGGNLRLRTTNSNSGVVTTTSGGKAKKITINWNYNTAKTINIYGKNTAYTSAGDLYNDATKGNLLAQYTYADQADELTIEGDYAYVGVRSNGGAIDLYDITFTWDGTSYSDYCTTFTVTLTANEADGAYWCTYYNGSSDIEVDANTTIYTISEVNGTTATLSPVSNKVIKAGEGVILKSTASSIEIAYTETAAVADDYTGNLLAGVDAATTKAAYTEAHAEAQVFYTLAANSTLGFYKYTGSTLAANKAFLALDAEVGASARGFVFSFDDATGVDEVRVKMEEGRSEYFNLKGQRVNKPAKGLYIKDGKKVVIK